MLRWQHCLLLLVLSLPVRLLAASAVDDSLFQLSPEALGNINIHLATGTPKPLRSAPAVASVITAQELQALGARTIDDALQLVPGLQVSRGGLLYGSRYYFRGIFMNSNARALILVNGLPMTSLFLGDRLMGWPGVPVSVVQRIEVIRGPGSAVFGADAFAGVINIITKGPDDVTGGEAGISYGSYATLRGYVMQRFDVGDTRTLVSLSSMRTDGDSRRVTADWATSFNDFFGGQSSFAPGRLNLGKKSMDFRFDTQMNAHLRLRGYWQSAWDMGSAQGIGDSLDPQGRFENRFGGLNLSWQKNIAPDWSLETLLSYDYKQLQTQEPTYLLPPGLTAGSPPNSVVYAQGLQLDMLSAEQQARSDVSLIYTGWQQHRLRLSAGYFWGDLYHSEDRQNFYIDAVSGLPLPLPGMTDYSDTDQVLVPEAMRKNYHAVLQDEWQFADNWELTSGLRYDHFSDFGETFNPRLALVWNTTAALTSKLLYGEAFRAPSFTELYLKNSVIGRGDPNLKPEQLKSLELAFDYRPSSAWALTLNLYQYRIDDAIDFTSNPDPASTITLAQNVGEFDGKGVETEVRYQLPNLPLRLLANYSHQDMINSDSHASRGQTPLDKAHLRASWQLADNAWLTAGTTWYGRQKRQQGDARSDLPSYAVFDLILRLDRVQNRYSLTLAAHNLFNQDVREPSNGPANSISPPRMPDDLPQAGRSIDLTLSCDW